MLDVAYYSSERYGKGAGPVLMDYVNCTGSEGSLWRGCTHLTHYFGCSHNDDVGVRCQPGGLSPPLCMFKQYLNLIYTLHVNYSFTCMNWELWLSVSMLNHGNDLFCLIARCSDGQLRLTDGPVERYGRVEICSNRRWETFPISRWSPNNALVACIELGFQCTQVPVI